MTSWQKKLIEVLPEPLRNDVKKTCVLGGLLAAFLGVMWIQFGRGHGDEAEADVATAPASVAPQPSVAPAVARPTSSKPSASSRVARWLETPAPALDRNVFLMRLENFQAIAVPEQSKPAARVVEEELFWDELAKSLGARADQRRQRQIWIDNLAGAAGQIRVETTIMGRTPVAMINGRRAGLGDALEVPLVPGSQQTVTFRVAAIEPRRIVVERDGMKFEIPMSGGARVIHGAAE
jgi:hypothetical protein